jgi:hypothetical protein
LTNLQLDVVDDLAPSIRLAQLDGLELQHTSSFVTAGRVNFNRDGEAVDSIRDLEAVSRIDFTSGLGALSTSAIHFQNRR